MTDRAVTQKRAAKLVEAVAIAAVIAVVAMILRSDHSVLRAAVILAIFFGGFVNDVVPRGRSR